jgi:hypothetical protein
LLTICVQLALYVVSAVVHAAAFVRWKRSSSEEKLSYWSMFGWFTGLSFGTSLAGTIAYVCRLNNLVAFYTFFNLKLISNPTASQLQNMEMIRASNRRWVAAYVAVCPFELALIVAVMLIIIHRMYIFAMRSVSAPKYLPYIRNGLIAVTSLINAIGICSNFGTAFYFNKSASLNDEAADAYAANSTVKGAQLHMMSNEVSKTADRLASVQRFTEVLVLIVVVLCFVIVGVLSARTIASGLRDVAAAKSSLRAPSPRGIGGESEQISATLSQANLKGKLLQRKIVCTFTFCFLTLLLRSIYSVIYAVASALQNNDDPCGASLCDPCKNVYSNIHGWILYTPVLQQTTYIIASPITLLVALWGMTGTRKNRSSDVNETQVSFQKM